jgi:hypothetical protein
MKKLSFAALLLALICGDTAPSSLGNEPSARGQKTGSNGEDIAALMKRKLENSQRVLEGLALNNFDKIAKHAEELINISKQAEWKIIKTPDYELHSNEFRRSVEEMVKKAKDKNLDGATLAYMDMTFSCVRCHKYVRETRRTQLDRPGRPVMVNSK